MSPRGNSLIAMGQSSRSTESSSIAGTATSETITEIGVSPEHPAEVRRVTVTNHGDIAQEIELTTYAEWCWRLAMQTSPTGAFSNMFVEMEAFPEKGALLARRRSRAPEEPDTWLVQILTAEENDWGHFEFDCSRSRFLGGGVRWRVLAALADASPLACRLGDGLESGSHPPKEGRPRAGQARAHRSQHRARSFSRCGAGPHRYYCSPSSITRTFELGWADARVELRHLGMTAAQADRCQRLLSAVIFPERDDARRTCPRVRFTALARTRYGHTASQGTCRYCSCALMTPTSNAFAVMCS